MHINATQKKQNTLSQPEPETQRRDSVLSDMLISFLRVEHS